MFTWRGLSSVHAPGKSLLAGFLWDVRSWNRLSKQSTAKMGYCADAVLTPCWRSLGARTSRPWGLPSWRRGLDL